MTEGKEYAILTNEISKAWSGMTTRQYKDLKSMRMRKYYYIAYLADRILLEILFGKKEKVDEMIQDIWH